MPEIEAPVERSIEERIEALVESDVLQLPGSQIETPKVEAEAPKVEAAIEGEDPPSEHYEFEFKGAKYQVPPELKELHEGHLRQEDYTKKTQEVADLRRQAEAASSQAKLVVEMQEALRPQYEQLAVVNMHLKRFQSTDWNALTDADPVGAQKQLIAYQQLRDFKAQAEQGLETAKQKHEQGIRESRAKAIQEGNKILGQAIKGWSPEKASELGTAAMRAYGYTESEISEVSDPRRVQEMHDAYQWRKLQESKPQLANKVAVAAKTLKPQASDSQDPSKVAETELRHGIRSAKTDTQKTKYIQKLLESRVV